MREASVPCTWVADDPQHPSEWTLFSQTGCTVAYVFSRVDEDGQLWVGTTGVLDEEQSVGDDFETDETAIEAVERALGVRGVTTPAGFDAQATEELR